MSQLNSPVAVGRYYFEQHFGSHRPQCDGVCMIAEVETWPCPYGDHVGCKNLILISILMVSLPTVTWLIFLAPNLWTMVSPMLPIVGITLFCVVMIYLVRSLHGAPHATLVFRPRAGELLGMFGSCGPRVAPAEVEGSWEGRTEPVAALQALAYMTEPGIVHVLTHNGEKWFIQCRGSVPAQVRSQPRVVPTAEQLFQWCGTDAPGPGLKEYELIDFRAKFCRETGNCIENFDHFCPVRDD